MIDEIKDLEIKYLKKELSASNRVKLHENLNIVAEMVGFLEAKVVSKDNEIEVLKYKVKLLEAEVHLKIKSLFDISRQQEEWFEFFKDVNFGEKLDTMSSDKQTYLFNLMLEQLANYNYVELLSEIRDDMTSSYWKEKYDDLYESIKKEQAGYHMIIDSKILEGN